jgi:hypothetical protein
MGDTQSLSRTSLHSFLGGALPILLGVIVLAALALAPAASARDRYDGWVEGVGSGSGHQFIVGNGLNLVFVDRRRSHTHYRACWHKRGSGPSHRHCWHWKKTGRPGERDRTSTAAPSQAGRWKVEWFVHGHHRVASWAFHNGRGD